jgi:deoxyribonuclease II
MMKLFMIVSSVLLVASFGTHAQFQCIGPDGSNVDWYIALKYPIISDNVNPIVQTGMAYSYMDSTGGSLTLAQNSLNDSSNPLARTLQQMYDHAGDDGVGYFNYNDECPSGKVSSSRGHTKGVIQFGQSTGYWLIHSTPKWPPLAADGYVFPHGEIRYGQSYLCVSYSTDTFNDIATQLEFTWPQMCETNFNPGTFSSLPNMADVVKGNHVLYEPYTSIKVLTSLGGNTFTSLAKDSRWDSELYENMTAHYLQDDLQTETWQNGVGKMESMCICGCSHRYYELLCLFCMYWLPLHSPA